MGPRCASKVPTLALLAGVLLGVLSVNSVTRADPAGDRAAKAEGRGEVTGSAPSAGDLVAQARLQRYGGRLGEALATLRRAEGTAAGDGAVLRAVRYEVARVALQRRDFGGTVAACRALGTLPKAAAEGQACVAEAHLLQRRSGEALEATARALRLDPHCYEAKVAEGMAHAFALHDDEAQASLREATTWQPGRWEAFAALGRTLLLSAQEGSPRQEQGVTALRRARELAPGDPEITFDLAAALVGPTLGGAPVSATSTATEAAGLFAGVVAVRPSHREAWLAWARLALQLHRSDEALRAAEGALAVDGSSGEAHALRGRVFLESGRFAEARREAAAASASAPQLASARLLAGDVEARDTAQGDVDLAAVAYEEAFDRDRADVTPLLRAAQVCLARERPTTARAYADKATRLFPDSPAAWQVLADVKKGSSTR